CGKIANHFTYKRGEARQKSISQGIDSTKLDSDLFALDRKEDVSRSRAEEEWYRGLSDDIKKDFDDQCLAASRSVLPLLLSSSLSTCVHGPLARLAMEYAGVIRRYRNRRNEYQKQWARRSPNHTVVASFVHRLAADEKDAKSRLVGKWLREL